jgi:hypothetical protein
LFKPRHSLVVGSASGFSWDQKSVGQAAAGITTVQLDITKNRDQADVIDGIAKKISANRARAQ